VKIKTAIFGFGYWGKNIARNFFQSPVFELVAIADPDPGRQNEARLAYPTVHVSGDPESLLNSGEIQAVGIITPVDTHFELAQKALQCGKHVLVEKPMTGNLQQAISLLKTADENNLTLLVDHTFLYSGAVQKIRELIERGETGKIDYFDSTRINLGIFQSDINVLWDLAAHDISIINYLIDERPVSVQAIGKSHTINSLANIAYLTMHYESGLIAHCNCSWSSPVKIRQMLIGGRNKMVLYNDIEPTDKVKVYDLGYEIRTSEDKNRFLVDYRMGDIFAPKVSIREALQVLVEDFGSSITGMLKPVSDGRSALEVVKILTAADESMRSGGTAVTVEFSGVSGR